MGTYYPFAGGQINPNGTPVLQDGKPIRDLQMTTIDPHDFYQESLKVDLIIPGTPKIKDFRDFNEPTVQVWDNITFADNYYQTVADPNGSTWTPNGRFIPGADVNILLNGRTGFTSDDRWGEPHGNVFSWYAGTADLAIDEVDNGYTQQARPVYDQLGEQDLTLSSISLTPWYSASENQNSTEGLGTGWYYSALGGGHRPTVDISNRVSVDFDNTDEDIVSGDFAVPTIFNGSFDVGFSDDPNASVAGWSFHNGGNNNLLLRKYLVDLSNIPTLAKPINELNSDNNTPDNIKLLSAPLSIENRKNFALQLGGTNPNTVIHNEDIIDSWGVLKFDIHAPILSGLDDVNNFIYISVEDDAGNFVELKSKDPKTYYPNFDETSYTPNINRPAVDLRPVDAADPLTIQGQTNRVAYGSKGFETFFVDIPNELRGKVRKIKFDLNVTNTSKIVYIDNIGIQSSAVKFGIPKLDGQQARTDEINFQNNYLSEKPQFTLSYNRSTKLPNWVSWQLDNEWIPDVKTPRASYFAEDISLPFPGERVTDGDYRSSIVPLPYNRGHLAVASDWRRDFKDAFATFLTSNVIPQGSEKSNGGDSPWNALENDTHKLAKAGKDIYIIAGGLKAPAPPLLNTDQPLTGIDVPTHAWKLILVLDQSGLSVADIQKNPNHIEDVIAVIIPNVDPNTTFPNTFSIPAYPYQIEIKNLDKWKDWQNWRVSLRELQKVTNLQFFSAINNKTREIIEDKSLPKNSPLLVETELAVYPSTISEN